MFLAEHLDREEVHELIRNCCLRLHNQDSSNIILFLAHHSRDERVYESVVSVLQRQFAEHKPVNLDNDIDVVNRLVDSTPELIYFDRDPLENRAEQRELQDETEAERQEFVDRRDALPAEIIAIISLVKTLDILGQFLKNHYGQLKASVKKQLLKELFDGGLRALRDLLEMLVSNSDGLIRYIEGVLEKRGLEDDTVRRNTRAKKEMFELLGSFTFGFIRRCGVAVASPHLLRVIEGVVTEHPTTAYRLVRLAIDLEQQGGLNNTSRIRDLNQNIEGNALAQRVLGQIVVTHMHLYSTTIRQKQKICQELGIEIQHQRLIDYRSKGRKRGTL